MKIRLTLILLFTLSFSSFASEDYYQFSSQNQKNRFNTLTTELRCLVCQNQNLAESNAPLASDLRDKVYSQVTQGKSNKEIIDYLVKRYGNFVIYKPPLNQNTLALWFGPFILLLGGILYLLYAIKQKKRD